jgi:hypothetical protein
VRKRLWWSYEPEAFDETPREISATVFEPEDKTEYSGLLDAKGNKLVREKHPCGFAVPRVK